MIPSTMDRRSVIQMRRTAALALVLLSVAACGSASSASSHQVGQVTFGVSGGIAGWNRQLVVDAGGTARLTVVAGPPAATGPHAVAAQSLERLRAQLSDPAFAHLHAEYRGPAGAADMQTYVLSAQVDGKTVTTSTSDVAVSPQILKDLISTLMDIVDSFNGTVATCSAGYSAGNPALHLAITDDGTTQTVSLCTAIWIVLDSPKNEARWQSVESSNPSVLEIVPLPLPHPPGGGTEAVYLAKSAGIAKLFAGSTNPACPPGSYCPFLPTWSATITVG